MEIVEEAYSKENNIKPTACKHNVQPSQIRRWKKRLETLLGQNGMTEAKKNHILSLKSTQKGRHRTDNEAYESLKLYYENVRNMDRVVTVGMLSYELKRLTTTDVPMSTLRKRIYRWLENENIVQRRVTHVAQNTRHDESRIEGFVQYVNGQISSGQYLRSNVVNIDETNVYFDMNGSITLADRGSRTVSVKSSGASARCSILLGVTMDGNKLPPFVIFRGKPGGRISREWTGNTAYPSSSVYAVQEKAWMDKRVFLEWVEKIWKPFCQNKNSTYLLMDEFSVHLMAECVNSIQDCGTEVDFVLGGYTSKLQVLDVGVNKPFKDYIKQCYEQFMVQNFEERKVSRLDVAKWIQEAWGRVTIETIRNTWSSIGFINTN